MVRRKNLYGILSSLYNVYTRALAALSDHTGWTEEPGRQLMLALNRLQVGQLARTHIKRYRHTQWQKKMVKYDTRKLYNDQELIAVTQILT